MTHELPSEHLEGLRSLLEAFASGFPSLEIAQELEGFIASALPPEHPLQQLADVLAQYRPGGGEMLYSEVDVLPQIGAWLRRISESKP